MPEEPSNILRVGIDDAPPVPMQMGSPETGDFKGYEVSLLNALANRLGVSLAYRRAFWSVIVAELSAGNLDLVCSAATVTAERAEQVDFCSPHLEIALSVVTREDSLLAGRPADRPGGDSKWHHGRSVFQEDDGQGRCHALRVELPTL